MSMALVAELQVWRDVVVIGQFSSQSLSPGFAPVSNFTWPVRRLECASFRKSPNPRFSTFSAIDKIRSLSNSTTRWRISGSACFDDFSASPATSATFRRFRIKYLGTYHFWQLFEEFATPFQGQSGPSVSSRGCGPRAEQVRLGHAVPSRQPRPFPHLISTLNR